MLYKNVIYINKQCCFVKVNIERLITEIVKLMISKNMKNIDL